MRRKLLTTLLFVIFAAGGLCVRLPFLDTRPMHTDEAVHGIKFARLLDENHYRYDPQEYHGPTLNYSTLPACWIGGITESSRLTDSTLRMVNVIYGTALVCLTFGLLARYGLVWAISAGLLTMLSAGLVFYSRYYIQEILLVVFTLCFLMSLLRYLSRPSAIGAILIGVFAGLMYATKETCIISFGAAAAAAWLTRPKQPSVNAGKKVAHGGLGLASFAIIVSIFFSSFFSWPQGIAEAFSHFRVYFDRAGQSTGHIHPWFYYISILISKEAVSFALFAVAVWAIFRNRLRRALNIPAWGKPQDHGPEQSSNRTLDNRLWNRLRRALNISAWGKPHPTGKAVCSAACQECESSDLMAARFFAIYTLVSLAIYSAIPYKTPWSMLTVLHGMIIVAGSGIQREWKIRKNIPALATIAGLWIILGLYQAYTTNIRDCENPANPYIYSQTSSDVRRVIDKVLEYNRSSAGRMTAAAICEGDDYWPLPWYLRQARIGWYEKPAGTMDMPDVIICDEANRNALADYIYSYEPIEKRRMYLRAIDEGLWLRPGKEIFVFVKKSFKDSLIESGAGNEQPDGR